MTEEGFSNSEQDDARRVGRFLGLWTISKHAPEKLPPLPGWVHYCMRQLSESAARTSGEFVADPHTPAGKGFSFGNFGMLASLARSPEKSDREFAEWWDAVSREMQRVLKEQLGLEFPENAFQQYSAETATSYVASNASERSDFIRGQKVAQEVEKNITEGTTRETDATGIYACLLHYYEEISGKQSLPEVYSFLQTVFPPNQLGDFDRFRKLANRIGLSFNRSAS